MSTTTTKIQKVNYNLPLITAETVLSALYAQTRETIEAHNYEYGCSFIYIPKGHSTIFAQVEISETTAEVAYIVGCDPELGAQYQPLNYTSALRELRGYLQSEVLF